MKIISLILFAVGAALVGFFNLPQTSNVSSENESLLKRLEKVEVELSVAKSKIAPPGTIVAFAGESIPEGWLRCDGRPLNRNLAEYKALFEAISTTWGDGDKSKPKTNFSIPDLRGRVIIGVGQGPKLTNRSLTQKIGAETHTLTVSQMQKHSHSLPTDHGGNKNLPTLGDSPNSDEKPHGGVASYAGGSKPHPIMQPSLVVNYMIKL